MCEFKVLSNGSQIMEDIVIVNYLDDNKLVLKDILGMAEILNSALISEVNTLNQTLVVVEHPLINEFIGLIKDMTDKNIAKEKIDRIITQLNEIKNSL